MPGHEIKDAPDLNTPGFEPGTQWSEVKCDCLPINQAHGGKISQKLLSSLRENLCLYFASENIKVT